MRSSDPKQEHRPEPLDGESKTSLVTSNSPVSPIISRLSPLPIFFPVLSISPISPIPSLPSLLFDVPHRPESPKHVVSASLVALPLRTVHCGDVVRTNRYPPHPRVFVPAKTCMHVNE